MRKFLTLLTLTLLSLYALPQCNVSIITPFPDTLEVPCGSTPMLQRDTLGQYAIYNDFNSGTIGLGWLTTSNATLTNPCGVKSTNYLWFGNASTAPRNLTTLPMDLTCGGDICFELKFAIQSAAAPCEGPDLATEGVTLEYRIGLGAWTTINYFQPNTTGNLNAAYLNAGDYTAWATYCYPIPVAAQQPNVTIRWMQYASTTAQFDHWGLDSITISTNCGQVSNLWSTGDTTEFTTVAQSFSDSLYWVRRIAGNDTCYDSVVVSSRVPIVNITPAHSTFCSDELAVVTINPNQSQFVDPNVNYNYSWTPTPLFDSMSINYASVSSLLGDTTIYYTFTHPLYPQCSSTDSTILNLGGVKFDSMSYTNPTCFRDVNGGSVYFDWYNQISNPFTGLFLNGTVQGYTYQHTYNNLPADTYTLVIRDNRCFDTLGFRIELPDSVLLNTFIDTNICQVSPTLQSVTPHNGISPYTIYWDNVIGSSTLSLQSMNDTTISVFALDSVNCSTDTFTYTFVLPPPINIDPITDTTCPYDPMVLEANANGGLGTYTYQWWDGSTDSTVNITNIPNYTYSVIVSDGCMIPSTMIPTLYQYSIPNDGLYVTPKLCEYDNIFWDSPDNMLSQNITLEGQTFTTNTGDVIGSPSGIKNAYLSLVTLDGCIKKDTVQYEVIANPIADFYYDPVAHILLQNDLVLFENTSHNYVSSIWNVENSDYYTTDLNYQFEKAGNYNIILHVSNDFGCTDSTSQNIHILPNVEMFLPNAFTPNGDNMNEDFRLMMTDYTMFVFFNITIYNRWGGEVFSSDEADFKWDGTHNSKRCSNGVYYYVMKAGMAGSEIIELKGSVTLLD